MNIEIYPWQENHWQHLLANKKLPHALLLTGPEGLGKKHFALTLSHALLCGQTNAPCGNCRACHLIKAGSHSNLLIVEPAEPGQMIKIDQIRAAIHFANETALQSGNKFIIINPASSMNINAANALLKTLEEPAADTLFILVAHSISRLPATITSRCQKIIFKKPAEQEAMDWLRARIKKPDQELKLLLNLSSGSPIKAAELSETELLQLRHDLYQGLQNLILKKSSPIQLAAPLQDKNSIDLLNLILLWLRDLLSFKLTSGQSPLINFDLQNDFSRLHTLVSQQKILLWLDEVQKNLSYCLNSLNLNKQLLLEKLFVFICC